MYFYAQRWSENAGTWMTEGDQYSSMDGASFQLGKMRKNNPSLSDDDFRISCYLTPLSSQNSEQRLSK